MTSLLHLDASARPGLRGTVTHGSHTRALSHRFVSRWRRARPRDALVYRDLGAAPPTLIDADWVHAAFAGPERHQPWMDETLAESDALVAELVESDVLVIGAPLYNFGMPAALKCWIDHVVRVGHTFAFDPTRDGDPCVPLLVDKPRHAVLLTARGGHGMDVGGPLAQRNHLDRLLRTVLGFLGIDLLHVVAVEHDEDGGDLLAASVAAAHASIDALVDTLLVETDTRAQVRAA